jgi:uncharacterized protein YxeA
MKKILTSAILSISFVVSIANAHAYYGQSSGEQSDNRPMARYLRGEINSQECVDHYTPRIYNQEAEVYHSNGSKSLIKYSR